MGNCVTTTDPRRRPITGNNDETRRPPPREEDLHLVPGRLFSNGSSRNNSSSVYTQQGRKGINQDAMVMWEDFGSGAGILCGVFDGHGPQGHLVARKVRDALPIKMLSLLPRLFHDTDRSSLRRACCFREGSRQQQQHHKEEEEEEEEEGQDNTLPPLSAWKRLFIRSYKAMDKDLRSHPTIDCFCSGSTAVTLLKMGSDLFMGNIGDSRAILGYKDDNGTSVVAEQLTIDLKPDLPREAERIKRCKGRVFALQDEPEVPRVWLPFDNAPGLAMARAFGDFCLKDYGVISVPEFSHRALTERDQFVVLASDGVWDVLSNQEAVDIISSAPSRSSAAKHLVDSATREWKLKYPTSRMDDCAVVCLYLNEKIDCEPEPREDDCAVAHCIDEGCCKSELSDAGSWEPSLDRNFTVRSTGSARVLAAEENGTCGVVEDQNWSGLEGVTRVNSIVQLPRFSGELAS